MNAVVVRGIEIGIGQPKICISVTGRNRLEILKQLNAVKDLSFDIVEWRVDFFEEISDMIAIKEMLMDIDGILVDKPILFTFRSSLEGGQKWIPADQYSDLIYTAIGTGLVDLADVELFLGDKFVENLIMQVHRLGAKVIVSNHDFVKTPSKEKIVDRLKNMEYIGADIAKIAVMPKTKKDVLGLLDATLEAGDKMHIPIVTMAMGDLGIITRLSGEIFKSAITFGAGAQASAPGQMPVQDLKQVLSAIHKNLNIF